MVEGVIAIDDEQRMLFANDRAGSLLGFDSSAAVGRRLSDLIFQQGLREIVEKGLAGTEPYREELEWKGPPARTLALYISRFPGHGAPGAVVVVHDTTDLRQV
jgi:two-component system phosphate regulon sensor histidine kinase PhoR